MSALLEASGLVKRYRRGPETVEALRGVDLRIGRAELVAVAGPSGSGKTTLLNIVVDWEHPDGGSLRWADDIDPRLPWRSVGILPQRLGLAEELTIGENITLPARLSGGGPVADSEGLVERLGLAELAQRLPAEVSLGEQQRAAVARALLLQPPLVLADEPTGHQDEGWAAAVLAELDAAAARGTACLVATHDPEVLGRVHRVVHLEDGQVAAG